MLHHRYRRTRAISNSFGIGMADLAFVVLAFFVITLVPSEETGFLMKLEPWWSFEPPESYRMSSRNIFSISVYKPNELYVRGDTATFESLKSRIIEFVSNPNRSPEFAETPAQAVVSCHFACYSPYKDYLAVVGSVKAAYWELWEKEAMKRYKQHYKQLSLTENQVIKRIIPFSYMESLSLCYWGY